VANFESREITDSRKFRSKKIIYSETGGHVLTPFFGKNRSKGMRGSSQWKAEYNQPIEGRTKRSTRSANGKKSSTLTVGQQVGVIGLWQTRGSVDGHEEGGIQRNMPDGKYGGGGSIRDWQQVKSQFLECLRLLRESFSIFSSFLSLDTSKQCCDRLGVGFVLTT
jgi:hypothetical protein